VNGGDVIVRMGEFAVGQNAGDTLISIGLGSCIGLAMLDPTRGTVALAHIVFPSAAPEQAGGPGKFADQAVPALVGALAALGSARSDLEAVLVGGARMFSFAASSGLDVGTRNHAAARKALAAAEIPIRAEATGGWVGRTIHVIARDVAVAVSEPGGELYDLHRPAQAGNGTEAGYGGQTGYGGPAQ
jgi:chemotaxis protein CheD